MKYSAGCLFILFINVVGSEKSIISYSPSIASSGWYLCGASYCENSTLSAWNCPSCIASGISLTDISILSYEGSRAFVGYNFKDNVIMITFMGSSNIKNWIDFISFQQTSYPYCSGCMVHVGFYRAYLKLIEEVRSSVNNLKKKYPSTNLQVFGHGLGGAMSVHCAADLVINLAFIPQYVYTFGEPRVGNKQFSQWYNSIVQNHFRVTHRRDPVPHAPLKNLGFYHVATEIFYESNSSTYKVCDSSGEDDSCSNQYIRPSIQDHLTYMTGSCCCRRDAT